MPATARCTPSPLRLPRRKVVKGLCIACKCLMSDEETAVLLAQLEASAERQREQQAERDDAEKQRRIRAAEEVLGLHAPYRPGEPARARPPLF